MLYNFIDKKRNKEFVFLEFKLNGIWWIPKKIFLSDGIYFEDSLFSRNAIYSDYLYIIEPQIKNNENFFLKIKMRDLDIIISL